MTAKERRAKTPVHKFAASFGIGTGEWVRCRDFYGTLADLAAAETTLFNAQQALLTEGQARNAAEAEAARLREERRLLFGKIRLAIEGYLSRWRGPLLLGDYDVMAEDCDSILLQVFTTEEVNAWKAEQRHG